MHSSAHPAWVIAIIAGVFSFISPCVLPLIPGYLSMVSGLSADQLEQRTGRHVTRIFFSCLLFTLGLLAIFIPLGVTFGAVGKALAPHKQTINMVFGVVVIIFGLFVMNLLKLNFLYQDRRLRFRTDKAGLWAVPLMGIAFGAGWSPCIGPWMTQLGGAAANLSPLQAGLLFAVYGVTLGGLFIAAGVLFASALKAISFVQNRYRTVELASGSLLVVMGLLMVTGRWEHASGLLMGLVSRLGG